MWLIKRNGSLLSKFPKNSESTLKRSVNIYEMVY